jgi:hypothetical protein
MATYIHPTGEHFIHQQVFKTPIDERHQRTFLVQTRNFLLGPEHNARFSERNAVVRNQDIKVLSEIEPKLTPETNAHELLMPADMAVARYREKLKEWEARGWRIDQQRAGTTRERVAYAIPGPARRAEPKGWVLDPVPLLPGQRVAAGALAPTGRG